MDAYYEDEKSNLSPFKEFLDLHLAHKYFLKRLTYQYFLLDFNPGISLCLAIIFGAVALYVGLISRLFYDNLNVETPLGVKFYFWQHL